MPMNMSYCRFHNTLEALRECNQYLDDEGLESLSANERVAAVKLLNRCRRMAEDYLPDVEDGAK